MKRFICILFCVFISRNTLEVQVYTYSPIVDSTGSKGWFVTCYIPRAGELADQYIAQDDTIIGGINHKQLFFPRGMIPTGKFLMEDSFRRVFIRDASGNLGMPIFNFSLNVGDTFSGTFNHYPALQKVQAIDTVLFASKLRRKFLLVPEPDISPGRFADVWMEGVGSMFYGIYNSAICANTGYLCYYEENGVQKYIDSIFHCYPPEKYEGQFKVEFYNTFFDDEVTIRVNNFSAVYSAYVYSTNGELVFSKTSDYEWMSIHMENCRTGIYILKVIDGAGNTKTVKFVRQ
jgi:hypothetical protein